MLPERGRHYTVEDFSHDELHCQCQSGRTLAYGPAVFPNPGTFRFTDTEVARTVYPGWDPPYARLTASVGGATITYGAGVYTFCRGRARVGATSATSAAFATCTN